MAIRTEDTNNRHNNNETTEVLRGVSNVINAELQFFANSKKMVGTCMNCTRPQLAIIIEPIKKAFIDAKSRGVKLRYITEITRDSISACKELMTIVDDLRHLEGIKGNFMISDNQYLAPIILFERGKVGGKNFAFVATLMKDGWPQITPTWIDLEDGTILVNTVGGRLKQKNVSRDDRIAISVADQNNPYHMVTIRGRVVEQTTLSDVVSTEGKLIF
jgi:Pyridoxamine 5'-phosphate oxidase